MECTKKSFGITADGKNVDLFTLAAANGAILELISFGAAIRSFRVPDRRGACDEITLGFDTLAEYEANRRFFGATIGRVGNRIAQGKFSLEGKEYALALVNGPNHLHGGLAGFDRVVWAAESFRQDDSASVIFSYLSPDGEEGYPGNLRVAVAYTFTDSGDLSIAYEAETDEPTPVNLTNHTFWNPAGIGKGILDLVVELPCPFFLPVDDTLIPTGEILSVRGTPMDFTAPKRLGQDIDKVLPNGYDHCYVSGAKGRDPYLIASVSDPASGRRMEIVTDLPGVQFYSGNNIKDIRGAGGRLFTKRDALCLETQFFPDSVNRCHFPSTVLKPDETFRTITIHRFATE